MSYTVKLKKGNSFYCGGFAVWSEIEATATKFSVWQAKAALGFLHDPDKIELVYC